MPKHRLTRNKVEAILSILDKWNAKLTWELFIKKISKEVGHSFSRTALSQTSRIALAYAKKKQQLRAMPKCTKTNIVELKKANDLIKELRIKLERQQYEIYLYQSLFVTYQHNLVNLGIDPTRCSKELPRLTRNR